MVLSKLNVSLLLLLLVAVIAKTHARDVHVAPNGSDSNDGLSSGRPLATVQQAFALATAAGDRILLAGGTYRGQGNCALEVSVGSPELEVDGNGAVMDCGDALPGWRLNGDAVTRAGLLVLRDLHFRNVLGGDGAALYLAAMSSITVEQCSFEHVRGTDGAGIHFVGVQTVNVLQCSFDDLEGLAGVCLLFTRVETATVRESSMENVSALTGGGVFAVGMRQLLVEDVLFVNLVAANDGPVMRLDDMQDFVLRRATVTSCRSNMGGGGIKQVNSNFLWEDCVFRNNTGFYGGTTQTVSCEGRFVNCLFEDNTALSVGGTWLVENCKGPVYFEGVTARRSHSNSGVLFFAWSASPTYDLHFHSCLFEENGDGGAIGFFVQATTFEMVNCTMRNNRLAIGMMVRCPAVISNSQFINNQAGYNGTLPQSALWLFAPVNVTDCLLEDNLSIRGGGARVLRGPVTFRGVTFRGNRALESGGAYEVQGDDPMLAQCIDCVFEDNQSPNQVDVAHAVVSGSAELEDSGSPVVRVNSMVPVLLRYWSVDLMGNRQLMPLAGITVTVQDMDATSSSGSGSESSAGELVNVLQTPQSDYTEVQVVLVGHVGARLLVRVLAEAMHAPEMVFEVEITDDLCSDPLAYETVFPPSTATYQLCALAEPYQKSDALEALNIVAMVLAALVMLLSLVAAVLALLKAEDKPVRVLLALGCLFACSVVFALAADVSDQSCQAVLWLAALGYVAVATPLWLRITALVAYAYTKRKGMGKLPPPAYALYALMVVLTVVVCAVWQGVNPPEEMLVIDPPDSYPVCSTDNLNVYLGVLTGLNAVPLAVGLVCSFLAAEDTSFATSADAATILIVALGTAAVLPLLWFGLDSAEATFALWSFSVIGVCVLVVCISVIAASLVTSAEVYQMDRAVSIRAATTSNRESSNKGTSTHS
mmetsp:Transcript_43141/g.108971  ORF Transcript_43141/g.108971 Transcript_43141/m.108971 type:complete len:932 (+) Transcript_43141:305-3100(+)|eukprot:CAMPEP_0174232460 /NCGR_PEP_ID=MMETSP0417-20130205/2739_1 /TAXON_ID=242541 /ORGANISM="Mayorella sp, Strain BSH-02190019" /LENGTH=931 /DNA_ID=CAMNT_0015310515 /DNA_START=243 /DNA_END=3038 /DNA_ORIENTATION=-